MHNRISLASREGRCGYETTIARSCLGHLPSVLSVKIAIAYYYVVIRIRSRIKSAIV